MTSLARIRIRDFRAIRLRKGLRLSVVVSVRLVQGGQCLRKRYRQRNYSGSSLVVDLEEVDSGVVGLHKCMHQCSKLTCTSGFDTGPGFVFNLGGGPGVRVHQFGGGRPRRRPTGEETPQSASSILTSLLPLILLFIFPLLSSLFSGSTPSGPNMRFETPVPPHTQKHTSGNLKVPYYVNPTEVRDYSKSQWASLDRTAENRYMHHLDSKCTIEQQTRAQLMQDAQGWFFQDTEAMDRARTMKMPYCTKLNNLQRGRRES
jgi:hypothetical protein